MIRRLTWVYGPGLKAGGLLTVLFFSALGAGCEFTNSLGTLPDCGVSNCATGCCHQGVCYDGARQSALQCGGGGALCTECPSRYSCESGRCEPPPTCGTCSGCCEGTAFCEAGNFDLACGTKGQACQACDITERCVNGVCTKCSPANCNGCCDDSGRCLGGASDLSCGVGGVACVFCNSSRCVSGRCQ